MIPDHQARAKPTLEDLLRVKRTEKPDAAFWQDFERGMRQKQLAAIIEPRPWWLGLSILSRKIGPLGMPISAGAAAMLALVVMRVSPSGGLTQAVPSSSPEPAAVVSSGASVSAGNTSSNANPVASAPATVGTWALAQVRAQVQTVASVAKPTVAQPAPAISNPSPAATTLASAPAKPDFPLSAEVAGIATANQIPVSNDTTASRAAPLKVQVLVSAAPLPETTAPDASAASFALAGDDSQMDNAALNPRQARLLSNATEVSEGKSLASVREQVLHRLVDDEARYATISRVALSAERLSLKF